MRRRFQRSLVAAAGLWLAAGAPLHAQSGETPAATLMVSMAVQSSISLEFVSSGSGTGYCQPSGLNSSTATLNLGSASIAGDTLSSQNGGCVEWSATSSSYTITNYIAVEAKVTNDSSSKNYTLKAALKSRAPSGVTWTLASKTLSTTSTTISSTVGYGTADTMALGVTVAGTAAAGSLDETIDFTATAN